MNPLTYPNNIQDHRVVQKFREIIDAINNQIQPQVAATAAAVQTVPSFSTINKALSSGGTNPLNVTGLPGMLAQAQTSAAEGTHANRPVATTIGQMYYETDRNSLYITVAGPKWQWVGGMMIGVAGGQPSDLGASDEGFLYLAVDTLTQYTWSGSQFDSTGGLYQTITNNSINTVATLFILQHICTLAASNGIGVEFKTQASNSTPTTVDLTSQKSTFTNATSGSETSDWTLLLRNAGGALAKAIRVFAGGFLELVGKITLYNNAAPTDGQILVGNTGNAEFEVGSLSGGTNIAVTFSNITNIYTIGTVNSPTFTTTTTTGLVFNGQTVSKGAANSGGAGVAALVVPN